MRTIYRNRKIMLLNNVTQTSVTYFSHANTTRLIVKTVQLSLLGRERNTYFYSCLTSSVNELVQFPNYIMIVYMHVCTAAIICYVPLPGKDPFKSFDMKIFQYTKERKIVFLHQQTFFIFKHFLL